MNLNEYTVQNVLSARKFAEWFRDRGGIAVWSSCDLSNPGKRLTTPAWWPAVIQRAKRSPHWSMGAEPKVFTDPAKVLLIEYEDFCTFEIKLKRGSGMNVVLSSKSDHKVRDMLCKAQVKLEERPEFKEYMAMPDFGSTYRFPGPMFVPPTMCTVSIPKTVCTLQEWVWHNPGWDDPACEDEEPDHEAAMDAQENKVKEA